MFNDRMRVWCENCRAVRPVLIEAHEGRDVTGTFEAPTDVVCSEGRLIVATFYRAPMLSAAT
jgi:hypothetical protein